MRVIETRLYRFDELSDEAKVRAVEAFAERLAGPWFETEPIHEVILHDLAHRLGTPDADQYGCSDFPGIPGVEIYEWDIDRLELTIRGVLSRDNAPSLPWVDGIYSLDVDPRYGAVADTAWCHDFSDGCPATDPQAGDVENIKDALHFALADAIQSGADEFGYQTSEEAVVEMIEANEYEFTEEGNPA